MTKIVRKLSQTTHWKALHASKNELLGAHHLNDDEELVVQMSHVKSQEIKGHNGAKDNKPVLYFKDPQILPMVLNITNSSTIASLYGDKHENWAGHYIQIFATSVKDYGGGRTTGLRIRPKKPDLAIDVKPYEAKIKACKTLDDLQKAFMALPKEIKPKLTELKNQMKESLTNAKD